MAVPQYFGTENGHGKSDMGRIVCATPTGLLSFEVGYAQASGPRV